MRLLYDKHPLRSFIRLAPGPLDAVFRLDYQRQEKYQNRKNCIHLLHTTNPYSPILSNV